MIFGKDVLLHYAAEKGRRFCHRSRTKKILFLCVIGTTETAKIPGLSAAGKNPEFTDYTPAADVEYLEYGECKCISEIPVTPEGIPTPALITRSVLLLHPMPTLVVDAGSRINPRVPCVSLGRSPGNDIRIGKGVEKAVEIFDLARVLGEKVASFADLIIIGESIPGGTTTALAVLLALGINAERKISSSMAENPHELKLKVVSEAFRNAGIKKGELSGDPIRALELFGDPVLAAVPGLLTGIGGRSKVILAGGTQQSCVAAITRKVDRKYLGNTVIGTTRWLAQDPASDIRGIIAESSRIPILAANLDFSRLKEEGLLAYEKGVVKEGVGAGGLAVAAMIVDRKCTPARIVSRIRDEYRRLIKKQG